MSRRKTVMAAVAAVAIAGALTAGAWAATTPKPKPKVFLDAYTYDSFPPELIKMAKADMMKAYGMELRFRTFEDTGIMYAALLQERAKPIADVIIGLDDIYLERAKKDGLLQPYKPKARGKIVPALVFDKEFYLTPFDYGVVTFNYDSERLKKAPSTWNDLTSAEYRGKIVIENPLTGSTGQALLFATIAQFGESGYLDFWRKLRPNLLSMAPGWSAAYLMFTSGEAPIVLSYGTSPVYHLIYERTERYKAILLDNSAWLQVEGVGIAARAKNPKGAQHLVDYMLELKFQKALQETQFMYPVRSDAPLSPNFRVAVRPKVVLNSRLSAKKIAANRDRWLRDWEAAMNEAK